MTRAQITNQGLIKFKCSHLEEMSVLISYIMILNSMIKLFLTSKATIITCTQRAQIMTTFKKMNLTI